MSLKLGFEYISMEDLVFAYRKAKVDLYYIGNPCLEKLQTYESDLMTNLKKLHLKLNKDEYSWLEEKDFFGDWFVVAHNSKKFEETNNDIFSDPETRWKIYCDQLNSENAPQKTKVEFRLTADPSIDFVVLSTLWLIKVGYQYDRKLKKCAYGNRLRYKQNNNKDTKKEPELDKFSLGTFEPYQHPFRQWRDKAISTMREELEHNKNIIAITADVTSFYHNLNPDFLLKDDFLKIIDLELSEKERELTEKFIKAIQAWTKETPLDTGLPVGLPASAVVANMALIELDKVIQEQINPLYYGRYVDDIILVFENTSNFTSSEAIWEWVFKRSNDLLKWDEDKDNNKNVIFSSEYLLDSQIVFSNDKNKVFFLNGTTGINLVDSIARQIAERGSEWRALPDLPNDPDKISSDLVSATNNNCEEVDSLRKTGSLSMLRSSFAMTLRDFEAYERDLPASTWQEHRKSFLKAFIKHTLVLPVYFDLEKYLPRVIRLATACEDFVELKQIIEKLQILINEVNNYCHPVIKASETKSDVDEVINKWHVYIDKTVEESIIAAFPLRLSTEGKKTWKELFANNG